MWLHLTNKILIFSHHIIIKLLPCPGQIRESTYQVLLIYIQNCASYLKSAYVTGGECLIGLYAWCMQQESWLTINNCSARHDCALQASVHQHNCRQYHCLRFVRKRTDHGICMLWTMTLCSTRPGLVRVSHHDRFPSRKQLIRSVERGLVYIICIHTRDRSQVRLATLIMFVYLHQAMML